MVVRGCRALLDGRKHEVEFARTTGSRQVRTRVNAAFADVAWEGQARVTAWSTEGMGPVVTEDEELAALSAAMIPRFFFAARWSTGLTAKLLPTVSATATFTVQTPAPADRIEAALAYLRATVDVVPHADGVRLAGHLGSGFRNMNPTVFVIAIRDTSVPGTASVHIRTAAKEGLIKQRSAQKVIDRLRASIRDIIIDRDPPIGEFERA